MLHDHPEPPPKKTLARKGKSLRKVEPVQVKKMLKRPPVLSVKPTSGPIPVTPKNWKWKGKVDPMSKKEKTKSLFRIKPEDMPDVYPSLNKVVPSGTEWRMNVLTNHTNALVTKMPDGVLVAWANCGLCKNHVDRCICSGGIVMPKSIEHIWICSDARVAGIDFGPHVNTQQHEYAIRAFHWYLGKERGVTLSGDGRNERRPTARKTLVKPAAGLSGPGRKTLRKSRSSDSGDIDLGVLGKQAASRSKELEASLTKALTKKPVKKMLRKK